MKIIKKISDIANDFDTFIIDLWGVMHNGKESFPKAIKCVDELYKLKKNLIIISNSSQKNEKILVDLEKLGFNINLFNRILTSGQAVWEELKKPTLAWSKKLGENCYHLTNDLKKSKNNLLQGLNKKIVNDINKANFIIGSSADPFKPILEYVPILQKAYSKKLPFICVNPDYESVEKDNNNKRKICMGAIAKLYESIGGEVFILGKPSDFIYKKATLFIDNFDKKRTIAIGDSLSHDIYGAYNFGIKSIFISSGIHSNIFQSNNNKDLQNIIKEHSEYKVLPDFICEKLSF